MRYSGQQQHEYFNQHRRRQQHYDVDSLEHKLKQAQAYKIINVLSKDTIYMKDTCLDTGYAKASLDKILIAYIKMRFTYILSSPKLWKQILNI